MATRFLLKSPLPPRDRYRFLLGCEPASNCHGARAQLMRYPLGGHPSGSQSARLLDALAVVAHPAAGATEARVTSFTGFRIAGDLEGSTTLGTLLEPLEPIYRRRELQPHSAEQRCWHQTHVESRKVAAKAKSGFDVLAQSHVCKSLNQRQRSPGGILIIQMQGPLYGQRELRGGQLCFKVGQRLT
jgi:hypothetical protein